MQSTIRRKVESGVTALLILTLGGFAFAHQGVPAEEVDLNDGGVWVTNTALGMTGHLNYQSRIIDGGLNAPTRDFDISQEGNRVLLQDKADKAARPIDTATLTMGNRVTTGNLEYSHGANTVLIADTGEGKVWATSLERFTDFSSNAVPLLEDVDSPHVVVGRDGTGFVVDASGAITKVTGSDERFRTDSVGALPDGITSNTQLTIAGDQLVAVDEGRVRTAGSSTEVSGITATSLAQQPSLERGHVTVAAADALLTIPLGGGDPQRVEVPSGKPAAPVDVAGCVYGAWAGSGAHVRDCPGESDDVNGTNDTLATSTSPLFRVSRDIIVINDAAGNIYLPNDNMAIVNDWDNVKSQIEDQNQTDEQETDENQRERTNDNNAKQEPPVATDDQLGARPGISTTLPVLLNDIDPDGDVLTVKLGNVPDNVQVSLARNGRSAQILLPPDTTNPVTFTYQAFDGEDLSNTATVTVTPTSDNGEPQLARKNTVTMTEQATVEYSTLPDWTDPDGDPLYLVNATGSEGMAVTFRQDGFISVRDLGTEGPGTRELTVTVSDGTAETSATIPVQVSSGSTNLPPVANADHYVVNVGERVLLRPLSNDSDPNGETLVLSEMGEPAADETLETDYEKANALFSSTRVGSHELTYVVSDGPNASGGKIRVDVQDPAAIDPKPSAQDDLALLPPDAPVLVNVLDNDTDPLGGVLAVQSISVDAGLGITVEVKDHSTLRISASNELSGPRTFSYTVSNGRESATARVVVLPQQPRLNNQPPVVLDDTAVVRTGDIVAIPVLSNDYSPTGMELSVYPEVEVRGDSTLGEAFVSGDLVRFRAGSATGNTTLVYTAHDNAGNRTSGKIDIAVRGQDSANQKPTPHPVTGRVFAGAETTVAVSLSGVDPDGDSVELVEGSSQSPKLGNVKIEGGYLTYKAAHDSSGTDSFTYQVRDRFGAVGEASIQVGVVPPPTTNQLPIAVPDQVTVRPGRTVQIPVTKNDVDPDGDEISIVANSAKAQSPWEADLEIVGQDVKVVAPNRPGNYKFSYDITDRGGASVTGYGTLIVDEQAQLIPPVAVDDRLPVSAVLGKAEVEVPVLKNDNDPDGSQDDLRIEVESPGLVESGQVRVPVSDDPQVLLYTITDKDGGTARAAIFVPGVANVPPTLNPEKAPAKVKAGQTLRVDLSDYVLARRGHSPKLTSRESLKAGTGASSDQAITMVSDTVFEFTPDASFYGPTTLAFGVHDGESLDDPNGLQSSLSLPVEVEASGMVPPELRPSPVEVAKGEQAAPVKLRDMVKDPDPGDEDAMAYSLISAPGTLNVEVSGQEMRISATSEAPLGAAGEVVVRVHDGKTDPLEMKIPVTVVGTTRPLMTTTELTESDGRVDQAKVFDLTTAITNPFADQGGAITISGAATRQGKAEVSVSGTDLSVTPTEIGTVVVNYTASDATGDAARQVTGQVTLMVKGTPLAPTGLTARSDVSRTVELAWTQGDLQGGTLDHFQVSWNGGSQDCGTVTNCRITGLTNNTDYTFTVAQVTDVGTSEPSNSAQAHPDVRPNQPSTPTATAGDREIALSWPATQVPDGGSPVEKYNIQVSPGIGGQTTFLTSDTSYNFTGLSNGTAYRFRIQAVNRYAENNVAREADYLWSDWSVAEIPAGAPTGQGAPTVSMSRAAAGVTPRASLSWGKPANINGDDNLTYEVTENSSGQVVYTGQDTQTTVSMGTDASDRTFTVRSTNKSKKWSDPSPASNAVRFYQPPSAPTSFSLKPTGVPNQVTFSFNASSGNGVRADEISYRWNANGASGTVSNGQTLTNGAFANGRDVQVTLTPVANVRGETTEGESASASVNAYGPPSAPSISASGGYQSVTYTWSADVNSGGRSSTVTIDNQQVAASGSTTRDGLGANSQSCATITVTNSEGQQASNQACGTSWQAPETNDRRGTEATGCPAGWGRCDAYEVRLQRWKPNSTVHCNIPSTTGEDGNVDIRVDANGSWGWARYKDTWRIGTQEIAGNVTEYCTQQ